MKANILQRILSIFRSKPKPEFMAQQLRKPSGRFAKKIAENMNQVNEPLYAMTLDNMMLTGNDSVLEIGFGSGKFFDRLFLQSNQLQVSGIDYSQEMVDEAKDNNKTFIASGQLNLQLGNSDNLPFADSSFDKVFCNMVIYFWDQPEKHLKEIYRVLKPKGKFYTGLRTKESMLRFPFTQYGFRLYEQDEWNAILRQNGFSVINVAKKSDPYIEYGGESIQLESVCIVAEKKNN